MYVKVIIIKSLETARHLFLLSEKKRKRDEGEKCGGIHFFFYFRRVDHLQTHNISDGFIACAEQIDVEWFKGTRYKFGAFHKSELKCVLFFSAGRNEKRCEAVGYFCFGTINWRAHHACCQIASLPLINEWFSIIFHANSSIYSFSSTILLIIYGKYIIHLLSQ